MNDCRLAIAAGRRLAVDAVAIQAGSSRDGAEPTGTLVPGAENNCR